MRKYKVWGGLLFKDGKQVTTIVATLTKKKALLLLNLGANYFNDHWSETGNSIQIEAALNNLEIVLYSNEMYNSTVEDFKKYYD